MSTMEFWAEVVKHDEPLNVVIEGGMVLHLSLACLAEPTKVVGNETVYVTVTCDGKKHVLATLFTQTLPQQTFDLAFDRDFQLSHNWKYGCVNFIGYKDESDISDSDEDMPLSTATLVKKSDKKVKKEGDAMSEDTDDSDSDSDSENGPRFGDSDSDDESDDSEEETPKKVESSKMLPAEPTDSDSSDESDESDEETPKKIESSKKRPTETSAVETPRPDKKAKATTQKKDEEKNMVHVATPFPGKKPGKTPASKPAQQTPKSGGLHSCSGCTKTFGSEKALESHSKAKHDGGK